ncbi:MAG: hypothetical protein ACI90V_008022 [Bacillariaceae sp.]|jgi:hypothetical protein
MWTFNQQQHRYMSRRWVMTTQFLSKHTYQTSQKKMQSNQIGDTKFTRQSKEILLTLY